jgi:hypothetical protein
VIRWPAAIRSRLTADLPVAAVTADLPAADLLVMVALPKADLPAMVALLKADLPKVDLPATARRRWAVPRSNNKASVEWRAPWAWAA